MKETCIVLIQLFLVLSMQFSYNMDKKTCVCVDS